MGCFSSFLLSRSYCAAFLAFVWPLGFGTLPTGPRSAQADLARKPGRSRSQYRHTVLGTLWRQGDIGDFDR